MHASSLWCIAPTQYEVESRGGRWVQTLRVEGVCRPWADRRRAIRCEVLEVRSPECYRDPILNLMRFHPGGREAKAGSSAAGWCGVGPSLFTTGYSKWLRLQIACKLVMIHACIFQHTVSGKDCMQLGYDKIGCKRILDFSCAREGLREGYLWCLDVNETSSTKEKG